MKRITLTFLAVLLTTAFAMAQAQWGVRIGYNAATISDGDTYGGNFDGDANIGDDGDEFWRSGLVIGLSTNYVVSESFSVLYGLDFSQRGKRFENNDGTEDQIRLNYLTLPLLPKFSFGQTLKGYLTLGPTFSYWTGGNVEVDGREFDIEFVDNAVEFDRTGSGDIQVNEERVNRFEFGGAIGGGVQLNTGAGDFLLDLRYTAGFTDLIEDNEQTFNLRAQDADRFRNQLISVSLIYLVPSIQE